MRIVFIGTGEIGLPVLKWLTASPEHELVGVVTQPDKPVGRDQHIQAPPIKVALADTSIPILQPERIKRPEAVEAIRELHPEVIVVMAYGQILPRAILDLPAIACLNLHASLLPKHRGAAPIQAAIAAGDAETGITVMYMDEGLDTGDILLQQRIPILPNETGGSLHDRLGEIGPFALEEALKLLLAGTAHRIPQETSEATYAPKLEREDGRIDWNEGAAIIERKLRAFNPWPGGYTEVHDPAGKKRKIKIIRGSLADSHWPIGQIMTANGEFLIGTSSGAIRLEEVQLEGKKPMSAAEFLRGHAWIGNASTCP